jgi:hypothetical protein
MKRAGISKRLRFEILRRDGFRCRYCGSGSEEVRLEIDHVHSIANGGAELDPNNLITACFDCNRGKSARSVHLSEFYSQDYQDNLEREFDEQHSDGDTTPDELPRWMLPRFRKMPIFSEGELANGFATTPRAFDYGQLASEVFEQMQASFGAEPGVSYAAD